MLNSIRRTVQLLKLYSKVPYIFNIYIIPNWVSPQTLTTPQSGEYMRPDMATFLRISFQKQLQIMSLDMKPLFMKHSSAELEAKVVFTSDVSLD